MCGVCRYVKFLVRVCKLVIPSFDEEDARRTAEVCVCCFLLV